MSGAVIQPGNLRGTLAVPPSKSYAHRAVIAASLAKGESCISNLELSQDIDATIGAMRALGAGIRLEREENGRLAAIIHGIWKPSEMPLIDCRESGSTLRFLIPVALAVSGGAVFTGSGRLGQRPIWPYLELFKKQGIHAEFAGKGFPLKVEGMLKPGEFVIPGGISSQFITGLMMAAPLLKCNSDIRVYDGNLESVGYVNITMDVLQSFGIDAREEWQGEWYSVAGNQLYHSCFYLVEGDWSQAAFPLLMGLLGGPVALSGLNRDSAQGDRAIEEIFLRMGGRLRWQGDILSANRSALSALAVDVSQCPDLAPAIAAAMALAEGESRITGGSRLRDKESDRIAAIATCLNGLGADVTETEDGLIIRGKEKLSGGAVDSRNDHRIAMMAAAVSPACAGPVILERHGSVVKSWPGFWDAFRQLGGSIDEQQLG